MRTCKRLLVAWALLVGLASPGLQAKPGPQVPGIRKTTTWVNPPPRFELSEEALVMTSGEKTDLFIAPDGSYRVDSANRLLFPADRDFVLSARISHSFDRKWDAGALVLEADATHWIKFALEKDYTGAKRVVSVVTKGISDDCNSVEIHENHAFFQVAKKDDTVYLYVSEDGTAWYLVRTVGFKSSPSIRIGFLAQSPEGKATTVRFSSIRYEAVRIKDFWKGE